jgi:hypothetical protein
VEKVILGGVPDDSRATRMRRFCVYIRETLGSTRIRVSIEEDETPNHERTDAKECEDGMQ